MNNFESSSPKTSLWKRCDQPTALELIPEIPTPWQCPTWSRVTSITAPESSSAGFWLRPKSSRPSRPASFPSKPLGTPGKADWCLQTTPGTFTPQLVRSKGHILSLPCSAPAAELHFQPPPSHPAKISRPDQPQPRGTTPWRAPSSGKAF